MDIASVGSLSIGMHLASVQQDASISILKKAMDMQESSSAALIDSLQTAAPAPSFGHKLDMLV